MYGQQYFKLALLLPILLISVLLSACNTGKVVDRNVDKAIAAIDRAIKALQEESQSWQGTMMNLEKELASDMQSTLANEVNNLMSRGIAQGGTELRCNTDFISRRMIGGLENIKRKLLKQPIKPLPPGFCQVVPASIDLRLPASRRGTVEFYGYDLDADQPVDVFLVDKDGGKTSVANAANYPTHYLMTLLVAGENGIRFNENSRSIEFHWKSTGKTIVSLPIIQASKVLSLKMVSSVSSPANHPGVVVKVPTGYTLIGGGCHSDWSGAGQLLTASYPNNQTWVCNAKDHLQADVATVTAYAIGVPSSAGLDIQVASNTSGSAAHPATNARLPGGYKVVSGGCKVNWSGSGNLLVDSFPMPDGWACRSKDHVNSSPATITAYAIGLKSSVIDVVTVTQDSKQAAHPQAAATLPTNVKLVGGGCDIRDVSPGNMLWATYPLWTQNAWSCNAKDHVKSSPTTLKAYAIGVKYFGE